jgi:hypothetical protein
MLSSSNSRTCSIEGRVEASPSASKRETFAVLLRAQQFLEALETPGNKQERITTTLWSQSFLQQMCAAVPWHLVQSARPGFKPLWILSSRSGLDSENLSQRTYNSLQI